MQNNYTLNDRQKILKPLRKIFGLTQQQVAEKANIALIQYQRFEYGSRSIQTASFDIICRILSAFDNPYIISKFYVRKNVAFEKDNYDMFWKCFIKWHRNWWC